MQSQSVQRKLIPPLPIEQRQEEKEKKKKEKKTFLEKLDNVHRKKNRYVHSMSK